MKFMSQAKGKKKNLRPFAWWLIYTLLIIIKSLKIFLEFLFRSEQIVPIKFPLLIVSFILDQLGQFQEILDTASFKKNAQLLCYLLRHLILLFEQRVDILFGQWFDLDSI